MKLIFTINGKATETVLAERTDRNYSQLEKDGRLAFLRALDSIPTGTCEMLDDIAMTALWSDGTYYATEVQQ